ncbi:MAG: hypothetical protein KatS3mg110_3759 [Pirellulaceae bacterium]|nr:MAG: hypothetical protein KatS3mg110_3759 [Pirellulaceae bacterium]
MFGIILRANLTALVLIWSLTHWGVFSGSTSFGQESEHRVVDALAAATDSWLTSVEFYCTFEQYTTTAQTWEAALAGQYSAPLRLVGTGEYAVSKDYVRHALRIPEAELSGKRNLENIAGGVGQTSAVAGSFQPLGLQWHDAARNKKTNVRLVWQPGRARFGIWQGGRVYLGGVNQSFQRPNQADSSSLAAGGQPRPPQKLAMPRTSLSIPDEALVADVLTSTFMAAPVFVWGSPVFSNVVKHFRELERNGMAIQWEITRPDSNSWDVTIQQSGVSDKKVVAYTAIDGLPMVTRVETYRAADPSLPDQMQRTSSYLFENFVSVTGGKLATVVRHMIALADGRVQVTLWRASGVRAPRSTDFIVRVPQRDRLECVNVGSIPSAVGGVLAFDITKMSAADLSWECQAGMTGLGATHPSARRWWLWVIGAIVVVSLVAWGVYRFRRRH